MKERAVTPVTNFGRERARPRIIRVYESCTSTERSENTSTEKLKKTVAHPCASDPTTTTPWMITPGPTSPAFAQRANDACRAPVHVARHALQPPMLGCWLAAPTPEEAGSADGLAYADSQAG